MCTKPIRIRVDKKTRYASEFGEIVELPSFLSPEEPYIEVGCGKCAECRGKYFNSLLQRALVENLTSYMYFVTLTYNNEHLPSLKLPTGELIYYSNYEHIKSMFKRFRHANLLDRDFRYICVNEYGDTNHRPHFHLLIFVAKKTSDDKYTPYTIEKLLFDNLRVYFSENIGTRKKPNYVPLFTFKRRVTLKGIKTNYFVKYVHPEDDIAQLDNPLNDTYVKTIRYIIGYVNQGSRFDTHIKQLLNNQTDPILSKKLSNILRSKVYTSKGFGCGFADGQVLFYDKISVRASLDTINFTKFIQSLPKSYDDFKQSNPDLDILLHKFINSNLMSYYHDHDTYLNSLSLDDYRLNLLYYVYFPKSYTQNYNTYFRITLEPCISFFFQKLNPYYKLKVNTTNSINTDSVTYRFIRNSVLSGINQKLPFLSFIVPSLNNALPLCEYYKERFTTIQDIIDMYHSLNISNFDQYIASFRQSKSLKSESISKGNIAKYEDFKEKICTEQKNCFTLHSLFGLSLYRSVL